MNITGEKQPLTRLWLESFSVVNRCTGKLICAIVGFLILSGILVGAIVTEVGWQKFMEQYMLYATTRTASTSFLLMYGGMSLGMNILGVLFTTACLRILNAHALQEPMPLIEAFSSAITPTIYQIVQYIIVSIAVGIVAIGLFFIHPLVAVVGMLILCFALLFRFVFAWMAVAVDGKGPIEGLIYSWKLTKCCLLDTLLMILIGLITSLLFYGGGMAIMAILAKVLQGFLMQYKVLAGIFGFIGLIIMVFLWFVILTFPLLVFLNRKAVCMDERTGKAANPSVVDLPGVSIDPSTLSPNPAHSQQAESTSRGPLPIYEELNLTPEEAQPAPQEQKPEPKFTPPPSRPIEGLQELDTLEVSQSSINTTAKQADDLAEHLDQVYKPQEQDVVQYADEDRMPTILFDDELAKQLLNNNNPTPKTKPENGPDKDGPDSIRMSR